MLYAINWGRRPPGWVKAHPGPPAIIAMPSGETGVVVGRFWLPVIVDPHVAPGAVMFRYTG